MNESRSQTILKSLPFIFSILFASLLIPMLLEGWFNLEITLVVFVMLYLVYSFTKNWIENKNYAFLIISAIFLISYPLKYAYIYYLISTDNIFIIDSIFDFEQTNYLSISNEQHLLFITYVISAFLGLFTVSFYTYKISLKNIKLSLENLANNKNLNSLLAGNNSNYLYLFLTIFFTIIFTRLNLGVVKLQDYDSYKIPFRLGILFIIIQKYILIIYGFAVVYLNKIRNQYSSLALVTKLTLYSYILFTGLYTTSKEYMLLFFIGTSVEILFLNLKSLKSERKIFLIKTLFLIVNTLFLSILLLFTIQARVIRNTTLCSDCSGVETIFFLFDFLVKNGGFNTLWELSENFNAININFFESFLLGTIFRLQGAECLIQIMSSFENNPVFSFPDLFGFFESISTLRQSGSLFYADVLGQTFDAGIAFAPSFLGSSLQISNSIFNPFIFTFSSCFFFLNLVYLLVKSKIPFDIVLALIISFDFLRGLSEGTFSYLIPLIAVFSLTFKKFILNNKAITK